MPTEHGFIAKPDGIHRIEYKKTLQIEVWNGGLKMCHYVAPQIDLSFHHPTMNDDNLHLVGGWRWHDDDEMALLERVAAGLKPMGWDLAVGNEKRDRIQNKADFLNLPIKWGDPKPHHTGETAYQFVVSALSGKLSDVFDLEAWHADWRKHDPQFDTDIEDITIEYWMERLLTLSLDAMDKEVVGLLMGYPMHSTMAIIDGKVT